MQSGWAFDTGSATGPTAVLNQLKDEKGNAGQQSLSL